MTRPEGSEEEPTMPEADDVREMLGRTVAALGDLVDGRAVPTSRCGRTRTTSPSWAGLALTRRAGTASGRTPSSLPRASAEGSGEPWRRWPSGRAVISLTQCG